MHCKRRVLALAGVDAWQLSTLLRADGEASAPASAGEAFTRKDVIYNLDNESDPEAEAAIKAFQRQAFQAAAKGAAALAPPAEPELAFTAKVERKYVAAQIVESGIQASGPRLAACRPGAAVLPRGGARWRRRRGELLRRQTLSDAPPARAPAPPAMAYTHPPPTSPHPHLTTARRQGISVPLSYDKDGTGAAGLKRYVAQLRSVARQAGFGEPAAELQAKLQEAAAGARGRGPCAREGARGPSVFWQALAGR